MSRDTAPNLDSPDSVHPVESEDDWIEQFCKSTVSLRVQGSAALQPFRGNCRKRQLEETTQIDNTPLTKRPRKSMM